ncbi:MAG: transposase-like protein [Lysobacterales bacterium]|jgi:transposase-like protein
MKRREKYPKNLKARVSLEAIKGDKTIAAISSEY